MNRKIHLTIFYFFIIIGLSQNLIFPQVYRFTGDPQIVIEEGNYKQVYNTGMYFYYDRDWELAIKFFSRCSDLTRKKTKHYSPLTWSYIYSGDYTSAIPIISKLTNRKEKQLIRLILKEVSSSKKKKKLSKREIDQVVMDKKDLIRRTRDNLISMSKHEIVNYGP